MQAGSLPPIVNPNLSVAEHDACLEILSRGLAYVRLAAAHGDAPRAEAIADALHNLPRLLSAGHEYGWTIAVFRASFLEPLCEHYPDLAGLTQPLDECASVCGRPRLTADREG